MRYGTCPLRGRRTFRKHGRQEENRTRRTAPSAPPTPAAVVAIMKWAEAALPRAANFGILFSYDGNFFQCTAIRNAPEALVSFLRERGPFKPPPETPLFQILRTRDVVQRADD